MSSRVETANVKGSSAPRYAHSKTFRGLDKIDWYREERGIRGGRLKCSAVGCPNEGEYGGHVRFLHHEPEFGPEKWYILPICPSHNNEDEHFNVTLRTARKAVPLDPKLRREMRMRV